MSIPLAILGFVTVITMLVLIMTKKASPLVALIAVPSGHRHHRLLLHRG